MNVKADGSALLAVVPGGSLWWIPLPAGEPHRLGNFETPNADILPDGRVVFIKFTQGTDAKGTDGTTDWFIADKNGLNTRKLFSLPGYVEGLAIAPDGNRFLFELNHDGVRRLLDIAADGTGLREIRRESPDECCFVWTPDERYLVYQSGNAQQSDIWLLPMQAGLFRNGAGKPIRLTNGPLPYTSPQPSRNGRQIFALGSKQRGELVRYDTKSHQFSPFLSGLSATQPVFSRDGKWVVYLSYPDHTLWRNHIDGSERMQLTFPPMEVRFPFISPDGTRIAFTSNDQIFVIDINGGPPQRIVEHGVAANWSPDGNHLLFTGFGQNSTLLQIFDLRTQKASVVPSSSGKIGGAWVTQDTLVAANGKQTNFLTFNLKTQTWADLGPKDLGNIASWNVSPDGKYLYFTTGGVEKKALRIRFADQQIEMITSLKDLRRAVDPIDGNTFINVAPDGSPIFTRDTGYQEIYALNIKWP